jgi:DNA-directed RNA polymerase
MWRNLARQDSSKRSICSCLPSSSSSSSSIIFSQDLNFLEKIKLSEASKCVNYWLPVMGFGRSGVLSSQNSGLGRPSSANSSNPFGFSGNCSCVKGYASAAEAIASEEDLSGSDEVQELMEEMFREDRVVESQSRRPKKMVAGMGIGAYTALRRRQIKMETEAWDDAAKEYQELLTDMCEHKLAPNLPYMKSLFLGWFEPLRDAIAEDQESSKQKRTRPSHYPHFDQLPADKMAVITMHKLMGLLMTNSGGIGSTRVVQAALQIGEAIEQEVRMPMIFILIIGLLLIW